MEYMIVKKDHWWYPKRNRWVSDRAEGMYPYTRKVARIELQGLKRGHIVRTHKEAFKLFRANPTVKLVKMVPRDGKAMTYDFMFVRRDY